MSAHSLPQQEGADSLPEADVQAYSVRDFSRIFAVSETEATRYEIRISFDPSPTTPT